MRNLESVQIEKIITETEALMKQEMKEAKRWEQLTWFVAGGIFAAILMEMILITALMFEVIK